MMEYQPNSNKSKEDKSATEKRLEKVVTGDVILKQKSVGHKFRDIFFGGDLQDTMRYVAADVLLPALRDLVVDSAINSVKRLVYGDRFQASRSRNPYEYRPRVSYSTPVFRGSSQQRVYLPDQPPHPPPERRTLRDMQQIIMASRSDAENIVERLIDIVNQYDAASIADLYDMLGLPCPHTGNKWGWTYLNNVDIRQVREGYLIDLPPAESL
jgi:hypothetical protein